MDSLLDSDKIPPNVTDPAITKTPEGALKVYRGTRILFRQAFGGGSMAVAVSGLLTDELSELRSNPNTVPGNVDLRISLVSDEGTQGLYSELQKVRGQASQGIGLLTDYLPERPVLAGELYALAGYAEVLLADLFCSGIPLSTLDYNGSYTYQPGSSTEAVFTHAQALFDTALALAGDSVRMAHLARVGQARALLARGQYSAAAAAAAQVPTDFSYAENYAGEDSAAGINGASNFALTSNKVLTGSWTLSVSDREGFNGLDYVSSHDPRTAVTFGSFTGDLGGTRNYSHPNKYAPDGSSPIVLASGVEARLIEAEAALQGHPDDGQWLAILNALRTDGTQNGGVYQPGFSGGYAGLAPLADPGTAVARVDLVFRERAFWLFLTGHRQGDLRRLIRQYQRGQSSLYPTGHYQETVYEYGTDVTARIPEAERLSNKLFTGCISTGA